MIWLLMSGFRTRSFGGSFNALVAQLNLAGKPSIGTEVGCLASSVPESAAPEQSS